MKYLIPLFLALVAGCGLIDSQSAAAKADQMIGLFLQYDSVPDPTPEMQAQLVLAAVGITGFDAAVVDATVPSATGLQVAAKIVSEHPDLVPFETLIAKLYTLILYGVPK